MSVSRYCISLSFRHGARTPVFTTIPGLDEVQWDVCTDEALAALPPIAITHVNGGARPPLSRNVQRQVDHKLNGGTYAGQVDHKRNATQRRRSVSSSARGCGPAPDAPQRFHFVPHPRVPCHPAAL